MIHLMDTAADEDSFLAIADHVSNLLNDGQVRALPAAGGGAASAPNSKLSLLLEQSLPSSGWRAWRLWAGCHGWPPADPRVNSIAAFI